MKVWVTTDKLSYRRGEPILVTVRNNRSNVIYAPPRGRCAVVSVQRLEVGRWVAQDACPAQNVYITEIAPNSDLIQTLGPAAQAPGSQGAIIIGPVAPFVTADDVRKLPTVPPWKPGDPVREVPEGAIAPPFSALGGELGPGTYRIALHFVLNPVSGSVQTVYSEAFTVIA